MCFKKQKVHRFKVIKNEKWSFIFYRILENSLSVPCTYQNKQYFTRTKIYFPSEETQQSNVTHVYFIPDQAVSVNIAFLTTIMVCMQNSEAEENKVLPDPSANTLCLISLWHLDNDICLNYKLCYCGTPDW